MYEEGFRKAWQRFLACDEVPVYDPQHTEFSKGRTKDLAFVIRLERDRIPSGVRQIAGRLEGLPGIRLFPEEYYHISVKLVGFLAELRRDRDDIPESELDAIRYQAQALFSRAEPFSIALGPPNVLGSFIVIEADDGGYIPSLQAAFREEAPGIPEYTLEGAQWLPHLSIGAFCRSHVAPEVKRTLVELRSLRGGLVRVERIELIQAELVHPLPRFRVIETYSLVPHRS